MLSAVLSDRYNLQQTIVLCNDDTEVNIVQAFLQISGIPLVVAKNDMEMMELCETKSKWEHAVGGERIGK